MNINDLKILFSNNSRLFNDSKLNDIDFKHEKIIENSKMNLKNLNSSNFRNWDQQNDMGLKYSMTYFSKIFLGLKKKNIFYGFFELFKKRLNHIFEYSSMIDDIQILKLLGAENLIIENPQNKTPGSFNFPLVNGYSVSFRWLRYLYILNQIKRFNLIKNDNAWLDIGSYYGGLQGLVRKYFPETKIIMLDFSHQLARSFIYLKQLYPKANHLFPNQILQIKDINDIPKGSFLYVELEDINKLNDLEIKMVSNFYSLGEMKKKTFENYLNSDFVKNSKIVYFANRFNSRPFYEKTYDDPINIFDYKVKKNIFYFDIFPMGHYQISNRKIFERTFFRNISSQYFEIIWKDKI